jgi:hypothetical protein
MSGFVKVTGCVYYAVRTKRLNTVQITFVFKGLRDCVSRHAADFIVLRLRVDR